MKTQYFNLNHLILIITTILFLYSCGSKEVNVEDLIASGDISELKNHEQVLQTQYGTLGKDILKLQQAIAKLDTTEGKYEIVQTLKIVDSVYRHFVEIQGNIETKQDVQISPEYSGVMNLRVSEGQYVSRGQLLATISDGGLREQLNQAQIQVDMARAQLNQAQIQADLAKTTYMKQKSLWDQKIGSEMQYLQAETNYKTAQKQVEVVRQQIAAAQKGAAGVREQLKKVNLYAPFSGTVEQVITKSGQVVAPGVPVLRLVSGGNLEAVAQVPEKYVDDVKRGTIAHVVIPSTGVEEEATVSLVSAAINTANRTFRVEIPISSQGGSIKPNQNAKILLNDYTNPEAVVIPETSVKQSDRGEYVYIATDVKNNEGIAKKVSVETGVSSQGNVEVVAGLKANDLLIIDVPKSLKDGDNIKFFVQ